MAVSAGATLLIVTALAGLAAAPGLALARGGVGGADPIGAADVALVLWLVVSLLTVMALLRQTATPRRLGWLPVAVQSRLRAVREVSLFGLGPLRSWTLHHPDGGLQQVVQPGSPDPAPAGFEPTPDEPVTPGPGTPAPGRATPTPRPLRRSRVAQTRVVPGLEPMDLRSRPLQPHVVERGETWWSLAERFLADGLMWGALRDLNLGSEVAPGIMLDETSVLRPGWRVYVPVPPTTDGRPM